MEKENCCQRFSIQKEFITALSTLFTSNELISAALGGCEPYRCIPTTLNSVCLKIHLSAVCSSHCKQTKNLNFPLTEAYLWYIRKHKCTQSLYTQITTIQTHIHTSTHRRSTIKAIHTVEYRILSKT